MSIDLTTRCETYVDKLFTTESKTELLTNKDFNFDGAHTVIIRKVKTSPMNDYGRNGPDSGNWSRFGSISELNTEPETFTLSKDRSFTFSIDKMNQDETNNVLQGATALARQLREVVVPEVDTYTLQRILDGAGSVAFEQLTADNIYLKIITAGNVLDNAEAPEQGRVLVVTPDTLLLMKQNKTIIMETDVGSAIVRSGVVGLLDGMTVLRVPANRLPADFGFAIVHPCATVGVEKLTDYRIHGDPPGISGSLVEGRIVYDAFVLDNKRMAIYANMNASYSAVENPSGNPSEKGYYEKNGVGYDCYVLTEDTTVTTGKNYYTKDAA